MEGPAMGRRVVLAEYDLIVGGRNVESGALRIDLDHRAMRVAARRHEGVFEWPERMALAAHQFGQDLGDMARLARRNRYVVDHCASPLPVGTRCRSSPLHLLTCWPMLKAARTSLR